ncbi:DUF300-domain-containing protein [Microthyrium microscopicum]|uniref:DUF300-domain-containing protein n=1 Tax=Microthyrium microscopicum TaxID=703497 RepID=A0A6A6USF3_9PEZI|nr:DUF300-domain-containing protein [Microthyrium microscopicum]
MGGQCNNTLFELGEKAVEVEQPLIGTLTFHQVGLLISVAFGGFACLVALILIFLHATHYSVPNEQKHIIRILFMIPIYATISVVSYKFYTHALYWEVLRDCYEAFAISSFFALLCNYCEPTLKEQKNFFRNIPRVKNWVLPINWFQGCFGGRDEGVLRRPRSGLTWFNIIWVGVFQYCFIRVVMTFTSMITQLLDRYCESSLNPVFAHIWVLAVNALSVTIAMYCLIQFYVQLKDELKHHKPFLKVACIKLVIFFSFWQSLFISFFSSGNNPIITTGPRVSYVDVKVGIPCVLLTIEMAIFSILHIFAFPYKPYDIKNSSAPSAYYYGGFLGFYALVDTFNPWDIIKAGARGFRWLFVGIRKRHDDVSYKMEPGMSSKEINLRKLHADEDSYENDMSTAQHNKYNSPKLQNEPLGGPPQSLGITRRPTNDDDFNDRAALLNHTQRPPMAGFPDNNLSHPPSGMSTPQYRHGSPAPAYAPYQQQSSTYQSLMPHASPNLPPIERINTPPSPIDPGAPVGHAVTTNERAEQRIDHTSRLPRQGTRGMDRR